MCSLTADVQLDVKSHASRYPTSDLALLAATGGVTLAHGKDTGISKSHKSDAPGCKGQVKDTATLSLPLKEQS